MHAAPITGCWRRYSFVVLPLQYVLVYTDWYGFYTVLIPVYVFLLKPVISALRGEVEDFLIRVAEVQWAAMVTIYFVSHVPALLSLNIPGFDRTRTSSLSPF